MMDKNVCIVVPFHKSELDDYEKKSLNSINKNFINEKKYLVSYKKNSLEIKGFERINFSESYFENIHSYNSLCLSLEFYEQFKSFKYILLCQLDVIVLRNNLKKFLSYNVSYIGAPSGKKNPFDRGRKKLWGRRYFCNGGFSLRKVEDFINVLKSKKIFTPFNYLCIYEANKSGYWRYIFLYLKTYFSDTKNKGEFFAKNFYLHEDSFWTYFGKLFYKNYKLPTMSQSNDFCFDGDPDFFYKKNKMNLPMALHGHHEYIKFLRKLDISI